ncbi:MAG: DUF5677 domain-containing protein [Bryobacter sp.]|nr:DUF5677 domain-containing protein [Bryobacter sp.]
MPLLSSVEEMLRLGGRELIREPIFDDHFFFRNIVRSVHTTAQSLLCLVANGYGIDALRLTRVMFETTVNAHFLATNPEHIQDFNDYLWIKLHQFNERVERHGHQLTSSDHTAKIAKVDQRYKEVEENFPRKERWCKVSFAERATQLKINHLNEVIYFFGSSLIHNDMWAIQFAMNDSKEIELGPSPKHLATALLGAGGIYASAVANYLQLTGLDFKHGFEESFAEYQVVAKGLLNREQGS